VDHSAVDDAPTPTAGPKTTEEEEGESGAEPAADQTVIEVHSEPEEKPAQAGNEGSTRSEHTQGSSADTTVTETSVDTAETDVVSEPAELALEEEDEKVEGSKPMEEGEAQASEPLDEKKE
jgi:hypothetical protein